MLIRSGQKESVLPDSPVKAGNHVGANRGIHVAQMRFSIGVVYRRGYVKWLITGFFGNSPRRIVQTENIDSRGIKDRLRDYPSPNASTCFPPDDLSRA
jgi:hypothetical protein